MHLLIHTWLALQRMYYNDMQTSKGNTLPFHTRNNVIMLL